MTRTHRSLRDSMLGACVWLLAGGFSAQDYMNRMAVRHAQGVAAFHAIQAVFGLDYV